MAIQGIEDAKKLKKWMGIVGRKGYGDEVIKIAYKIIERAEVGDYVSIAIESGKIRALTTGAAEDTYFGEKVHYGFYQMLHQCEQIDKKLAK